MCVEFIGFIDRELCVRNSEISKTVFTGGIRFTDFYVNDKENALRTYFFCGRRERAFHKLLKEFIYTDIFIIGCMMYSVYALLISCNAITISEEHTRIKEELFVCISFLSLSISPF